MSQEIANTASGIPRCPDYIAHPQSVWFEEHWRPLFDARDEEVKRLERYKSMWHELRHLIDRLEVENKLKTEALEKIANCDDADGEENRHPWNVIARKALAHAEGSHDEK